MEPSDRFRATRPTHRGAAGGGSWADDGATAKVQRRRPALCAEWNKWNGMEWNGMNERAATA